MKEAIVTAGPKVEIVDSPIPQPEPDQVIIKVIISGMNPKDWKLPEWFKDVQNTGDDIAGLVHTVGSNVTEFKVGDRVAAFHEMRKPGGSFAEYAVAWQHTTFHLPKKTTFEEGATLPLAVMTAALGLFSRLRLPQPWTPATEPTPLIIYGAGSAVGAFAIKLAVQANIHPLILVAGRGTDFAKSIPGFDASKGDTVVDYRKDVVAELKEAIKSSGAGKVEYAFDATAEHDSDKHLAQVLAPNGRVTSVLPVKEPAVFKDLKYSMTQVGSSHADDKDFAHVYFRYISRALDTGIITGHPFEKRKGLESIESGLQDLKDGKASATKYVFSIEDTKGAGKQ